MSAIWHSLCPRSQGGVEVHGVDKVDKMGRAGVGRFLCRCPAKEKPPPLDEEMAAMFICSRGAVLLVLFQIKWKGYRCRD